MTTMTAPTAENDRVQIDEHEVGTIYITKDYDQFKILMGNRRVNDLHVRRLIKSFEKQHLVSPITINENFEIIDGQHRYYASKELGFPIYYFMCENYGLDEIKTLNTNNSNWKKEDYLQAYCDLGLEPYIIMKKFMNDFQDFGIQASEQLITNNVGGMNNRDTVYNGRGRARNFEEGGLIITDIQRAYENAERVMMFKPHYDGFNRAIFISAMIGLFKNENYNHAEMISKITLQPSMLTHCQNVTQYKLLLEDIFNYKRRIKVNLRY